MISIITMRASIAPSPAVSEKPASATKSQATKSQTTGSSAGPLWGVAGLVLGGLIAVLAMRRFPNTRKAAAAEPGQQETTEVNWSPSDELSWPVQRK